RASSPGGSRPPRSPGSRRAPGPPPAARQASRQGRRELPEPRAAAECGRAVSRPSCSVPRPPGVVKKARRETSGDRRCEKITTSGVWVKPPPKKQKSERQVRSAREAVRCRRPATKGAARCIRRRACWKNESGDGPSEEEGDGRETASAAQASDVEDVLAGAAHGGRLCVVILAEEPPYDIARVPAV
ncbi:unnamed protein product, partial [Prorocentrum cordatum]